MSRPHPVRIVITGIGAVSPNGVGREAFAVGCREGRSGLRRPDAGSTRLPSARRPSRRVRGFDPASVMGPAELRRVPRDGAAGAGRVARGDGTGRPAASTPTTSTPSAKIGVGLGTGGGGLAFVEEQYRTLLHRRQGLPLLHHRRHPRQPLQRTVDRPAPARPQPRPLHRLHQQHRRDRPRDAADPRRRRPGDAGRRGRRADLGQASSPAFEKMRVVSTRRWDDPARSSRPFSRDRDGFVLGEGAWMFVLEDPRARPVARRDAAGGAGRLRLHLRRLPPRADRPRRGRAGARDGAGHGQDAGAAKDEIGYVNLHGTGTDLNDRMETAAVKRCFGTRAAAVPMSSTKSMIGHPQGACGAAGLAATVLGMQQGVVHPTINLDEPDPECDLDYIPRRAASATSTSPCATASPSGARTAHWWSAAWTTDPGRDAGYKWGRPARSSSGRPKCRCWTTSIRR